MIAAALLLSTLAAAAPDCGHVPASRQGDAADQGVRHVFQNGGRAPLRLFWIDAQGRRVEQGGIAPGGILSLQTFAGHVFVVADPAGRCREAVRIGDGLTGTYIGTSRYRPVAIRAGWPVFVDRALDPRADPARAALATIAGMLDRTVAALPAAALARIRRTPIFVHDHAGPGVMFHRDPEWLVAHGRTVEMVDGIEVSDAGVFVEDARVQPGAILHELTHAFYGTLSDAQRLDIDRAYRRAVDGGLYRQVKRHDGSVTDAYARTNAAEYFAELSEAYFSRNDFFPFNRAELAAYDSDGARLVTRLWFGRDAADGADHDRRTP